MKVYLKEMHSILDAIRTMYMSKRTWTPEKEEVITRVVENSTNRYGKPYNSGTIDEETFEDELNKLFKWGKKHITMLRFLDCSVVVEGLHRGGTDDFDSHAKRLENRIIRSSTRLADYSSEEMSDWYKGKIVPTDVALAYLGIDTPEELEYEGETYVRSTNGYIKKGMENNRDVKRGLYMLSLPMTFTFKVNIIELAHIYKERGSKEGGAHGTAAPELQEMIEELVNQVQNWYPQITRELLLSIEN
jgi:hypothetical protein